MKNTPFACLLLLALVSSISAGGVTINPGSDSTLSNSSADGGASGDNGNAGFNLASDFSRSSKWIKAQSQSAGVLSAGTGWANSQIYYDFAVGSSPEKASNSVGAWVSYSINWRGYQVILGSAGTNATVVVELELRDMTAGTDVAVETIHKLDLNTHSFSEIFYLGSDFNDSGSKVGTIAAVLKCGHSYRLTLRMSATVVVIVQSATPTICDYMDGFEGGGDGRVQLNSLNVKLGLDEKEVLRQVSHLQKQLADLGNKVTSLENKVTGLEGQVTGLEDHRHIYLTGADPSQNNVQAESSGPMPPAPVIITHRAVDRGESAPDEGTALKPKPNLYMPLLKRPVDNRSARIISLRKASPIRNFLPVVHVFEFDRERAGWNYLQQVVLQVLDVIAHYEFKRKSAVVLDSDGIGEQRRRGVFDDVGQVEVKATAKRRSGRSNRPYCTFVIRPRNSGGTRRNRAWRFPSSGRISAGCCRQNLSDGRVFLFSTTFRAPSESKRPHP